MQEETSKYLHLQELEEKALPLRTLKVESTLISPNEGGGQSAVKLFQAGVTRPALCLCLVRVKNRCLGVKLKRTGLCRGWGR